MRRSPVPSNGPGRFVAARFSAGCTTNISAFEFRQAQFPRVTIEPERLRTLFRLVWQIPTVAWVAGGVLLIAAPTMASEAARHWIIATLAVVFALSALGNAWGTRGRHFGWMVLGAVAVLAVAGY